MEINLKKLNENELIQICINKGITYQNLKTKKPYAKTTLISYIKIIFIFCFIFAKLAIKYNR